VSDLYEKRRTQNSISLIYESSKRGKYIASLEARIAELEQLAVVWHKYPDEKPPQMPVAKSYLCYRDGTHHIWRWMGYAFDSNPSDHPLVCGKQPQWWAELAAPPEEQ